MIDKSFKYTAFALRIIEKIIGSNFSVSGIDKLPNQPVLFVSNHFTRSETFFIPYLIYRYTGRQVRCLADSGLYFGALGRFLHSVGTISTKNPKRDNIILKDLISSDYDWMIYPEGSMLKSKEIKREHSFVNYTPYRVGPVRTGAAVLALKSQLYRSDIVEAYEKENIELLHQLEKEFDVKYYDYMRRMNTYVVPLTITYYPIRPGNNSIQRLAQRLVKNIPIQVGEELEIEGNILLGSEINVGFGDPINVGDYVKMQRSVVQQIKIISSETKNNFILRYFKTSLTETFMSKIYSDLQINLDHIFSAALYNFSESEIEINRLKRVIYLSSCLIAKAGKYRLNRSILEENLYKIFLDEPNYEFDSVFELAKKQGLITEVGDDKITINKEAFERKFDFHDIRRENTLQVIANEFVLLEAANSIVKRHAKTPDDELRKRTFAEIHKHDLEIFNRDYETYFDEKFSKDKSIGAPFFLDSTIQAPAKVRKVGVMVLHGYKSAPKEVEAMAKFLNGFGLKTYVTRMHGHGTAPINLNTTSFEKWYDSVQRGYAALTNISAKIVIVGFSTGGLLSLLSSIRKSQRSKKLCAIVSINAALKLLDIKARMVPGINLWNEMLEKFRIEKATFRYVDDVPENPSINYSRNYLKGVYELGKLMELCEENLDKVTTSALIIQSKKDPVVNPISGKMIYNKISSQEKSLVELDFSNHVIINSDRKEEVFEEIRKFLVKIKII
jgi:esterase/lipase/1-acyl-sn-glycerol-3-phosphate acyltransferase